MTSAKSTTQSESKNLKPIMITILDQHASRSEARQIATANKGRLPSVKEFILAIRSNRQLKEDWFWTADDGLKISKELKIDYKQGTVAEVSQEEWKELPFEQKAYASSGTGPVAIYFYQNSRDDHQSTLNIDCNRGALVARVAYVGI